MNFVQTRMQQEEFARQRALARFYEEQRAIQDRKNRNRALLIAVLWIAGIVSVVSACDYQPAGAVKRQPVAKSDLTKQEIKGLNVIKPIGEQK